MVVEGKPGDLHVPVWRAAYTVSETAELLGCHEKSLRRWIRAGQFPVRRIGGRVFVPASAIEELAGRPAGPERPAAA